MNIALDLDQVLVDLPAVETASEILGLKPSFSQFDVKTWGYSDFPAVLKDKIYELYRDPGFMFNEARPISGVREKLWSWKAQGHKLFVVTSRFLSVKKATEKFVSNVFPQIDDVYISLFPSDRKTLDLVHCCADVFVDDNPKYIKQLNGYPMDLYLVSNDGTKYNHWFASSDELGFGLIKSIADINLKGIA